MRFQLTLKPQGIQAIVPINYQYEISGWIYKTLHFGNPEFSEWLHNHGYLDGKKQFRFFTFSNLEIEQVQIQGDRLKMGNQPCFIYISFLLEEAIEPFIIGLFKNQTFGIGDKISRADFYVSGIEKLPEPAWENTMHFKSLSPVVISYKSDPTARTATYLSPADSNYEELFFHNLLTRYRTYKVQKQSIPDITEYNPSEMSLKVTGKVFSKMIKIKAGTPEQTLIKGFKYDFILTAPKELIRLGYYAGFGEKNSLGFGSGKVLQY
jgi:CRISPR-associated endoribonuclease Cas6